MSNINRPQQEPQQQRVEEPPRQLGTLRVGTAGWTNASWRGPFLPPGTKTSGESMLDAIQHHFHAVENNGTCHSMPSPQTVAKWKACCAKNFVMCPKMVKYVTHEKESEDSFAALRTFCDNIALLQQQQPSNNHNNLGPILIQFPKSKKMQVANLRRMAQVIQESDLSNSTTKIALELRHPESIQDAAVLEELRRLQWCLVIHPNSVGRGTVVKEQRQGLSSTYDLAPLDANWPITAKNWIYVRLHYNNDEHSGRYSSEELQKQAVPAIVAWLQRGIHVYAFVLNGDDKAAMPQNAKTLERLCYQELGMPVPRAPKQQARSTTSFFGPRTSTADVIQKKKRESTRKNQGTAQASNKRRK
ncbi:conserved protein [Seminavis robusta]|uniref:Conserved protein n=1 Tax=Seminavis robusta TaxID=568900 RepID=A0A9N8DJN1_9STRA|nr:conserved protein [Seminavis robusta]|eukprot:Sro158_g071580.1 conserved protein (359) ;mRNA; r:49400-50476